MKFDLLIFAFEFMARYGRFETTQFWLDSMGNTARKPIRALRRNASSYVQ